MTIPEFFAVVRGVAKANGVKDVGGPPPSDDDFYADLADAIARGDA